MSSTEHIDVLSIDCIIFGFDAGELKVLLIKKEDDPKKGSWMLPGGHLGKTEDLDAAAKRILTSFTGCPTIFFKQLHAFGNVKRHPSLPGRKISIAYYALVKPEECVEVEGKRKLWSNISEMPKLAFDHNAMIDVAAARLNNEIRYQPVGFELLPKKFTLTELQSLYEKVLQTSLDKRNFRKKVLSMNILKKLNELRRGERHRAACLFEFDEKKYNEHKSNGFVFEL